MNRPVDVSDAPPESPAAATPSREALVVVVGARGPGLPETLTSLSTEFDVVVCGVETVFRSRVDASCLDGRDVVSATDEAALVEALRGQAVDRALGGVVTFADDTVLLTSKIGEAIGVRCLSPETAMACRDKLRQREALKHAGLPVPRWVEVARSQASAQVMLADLTFPVMVKPTRGSGGALAFVVADPSELDRVVEECHQRLSVVGAVDLQTSFIVEEVIPGHSPHVVQGFAPYVSVESVVVDGERHHLAITDRFPVKPPVLETGMCLPTALPRDHQREVVDMADRALAALHFDQGVSHTEIMLTSNGPVVIEVNARVGGALPYLFPHAGAGDLFLVAAHCAFGRHPATPTFDRYALFAPVQLPLGVQVSAIDGFDAVRRLPGIDMAMQLIHAPCTTQDLQGTMVGVALGSADSPAEAIAVQGNCLKSVVFEIVAADQPPHYRRTPDGVVHPTVAAHL